MLRIHEPVDGAHTTISVPTPTGALAAAFTITRQGRTLQIDRTGAPAPWRILVAGRRARSATGGPLTAHADGALVELDAHTARATIELDDTTAR